MPEAYLAELERHIQTTEEAIRRWAAVCDDDERSGRDARPLRRLLKATEATLEALHARRAIVSNAIESIRIAGFAEHRPAWRNDPIADDSASDLPASARD